MFLLDQATHRMVIQYHPRIGHLYVPEVQARIPHESGGYLVRTNSSGFRADVEFVKAHGDRPRILVFGDSFTAGEGCNNEERYPELLGQELGVEVYNYGLSGSAPDQHVLMYEEFGRDVEADLIIWGISVHNIERIKLAHRPSIDRMSGCQILVPKPYFTLNNGDLQLHHVPVPRSRPGFANEQAQQYKEGYLDPPSLERIYLNPRLRHLRAFVGDHLSELKLRLRSLVYRCTGVQLYDDYDDPASPGWQLMAALIKRLHERVRKIPLLVVPLPTYHYYVDKLKPIYQTLYDSLADVKTGLHVYDLTADLVQSPLKQRQQLCFEQDSHYSPFGHQQLARLIAREIRRRELLPTGGAKSSGNGCARPVPVKKPHYILGISCFYHDSAAALIKDGEIVAAVEEERFTRVKNDRCFPHRAINYCLEEAQVSQNDLAAVVYYKNQALTFERIVHSLLAASSEATWLRVMPSWVRYKLHVPQLIRRYLQYDGLLLQNVQQRSHCASAFYPSPYEEAAILTIDGVGEWSTASIGAGKGKRLEILKEMCFPHSLGLLYSAFTQFTGFTVHSGAYEMMGLAPFGEPKYVGTILDEVVDLKDDGSIELHLDYFAFLTEPRMTNKKFAELFGGPARESGACITRREMDIARSVQVVIEEAMLRMARYAHKLTAQKKLCLAGSMALNCVANGRLQQEGPFEEIWIQPAAGDAGAALGAALDAYYNYFDSPRTLPADGCSTPGGSYWGPGFSNQEVHAFLDTHEYPCTCLDDADRAENLADLLAEGKVIGHFAGRSEFGPHALGARSILGDARNHSTQATLLKIKCRELFRPFAASVLKERVSAYQERPLPCEPGESIDPFRVVREPHSDVPVITHVDYAARMQTVGRHDHPVYYHLIRKFAEKTGGGIIVNTSFNVCGEPIVCTPFDAYRCFMLTDMDVLVMGNYMLCKQDQPTWLEHRAHVDEHREDDDIAAQDDLFIQKLRKLYGQKFVPLSHALRTGGGTKVSLLFDKTPSQWRDCAEDLSPQTVFTVPVGMDRKIPNPKRMAEAILHYWSPGAVVQGFKPVLAELLRLQAHVAKEVT